MIDLDGLVDLDGIPDGVSTRCLKESRWDTSQWPPAILVPRNESCAEFDRADSPLNQWEWDPNKNESNLRKHGMSFEQAVQALEKDRCAVRVSVADPNKWEKLEGFDFEAAGVPATTANTDRLRDVYVFKFNQKTWALISTLRGEMGAIRQRVISVRRAKPVEERLYDSSVLSGNARLWPE